MNRLLLLAAGAALVVALVGGAAFLIGAPPHPPSPPPATTPSSATPASVSTAVLSNRWLAEPVTIAGIGILHQPILTIDASGLRLQGPGISGVTAFASTVSVDGSNLTVVASANVVGCTAGASGTYAWTTAQGDSHLTLTATRDGCPARAAALARTWQQALPDCPSGKSCGGPLQAGTFSSMNLDVHLAHDELGSYDPTFGELTYTVGAGWAVERDTRTQLWLVPASDYARLPNPGTSYLYVFARPAAISQAPGCPLEALDPPIERTADAFAAWLAARPGVTAGRINQLTLDGHPARWLDVAIAPSWTGTCDYSDGKPYVPLLLYDDGQDGGSGVGSDDVSRFVIVDLGGGDLVIVQLQAQGTKDISAFAAQAMPIVEGFKFR